MFRALAHQGVEVVLTSNPDLAMNADGLVVPGVGAFSACMHAFETIGGDRIIIERLRRGLPVLGVCVGLQIMFEQGHEFAQSIDKPTRGLALIPGEVVKICEPVTPHMGWNTVHAGQDSKLMKGVEAEQFYFVHSFAALQASKPVTALHNGDDLLGDYEPVMSWCTYGDTTFVASYERGPLSATQFHPEKSAQAGATLLRNWVESLPG